MGNEAEKVCDDELNDGWLIEGQMAYCESLKVGNRCAAIPAGVRDGGEMR